MKPIYLYLLAAIAFLSLAAWEIQSHRKTAPVIPPPPGPANQAAEAWATKLEKDVMAQNTEAADAALDLRPIFDRIFRENNLSDKQRRLVSALVRKQGKVSLMDPAVKQVAAGAHFKFLRLRQLDGHMSALFRMIGPDGWNYTEYFLEVGRDGKVVAVDEYVHRSGEKASDLFRRMFAQLLQGSNKEAGEMCKAMDICTRAIGKLDEGDAAGALADFKTVPPSFRNERWVMLIETSAAAKVSDEEYMAAIERMRNRFPDDPGLDMIWIDWYGNKNQHENALAAIDRVDKRLGGDPYLQVLRAGVYCEQNMFEKARSAANEAIKADPGMVEAYQTLMTVACRQKDYGELVRLLTKTENEFDFDLSDLGQFPDFADFIKSPEYKAWASGRKPKSATASAPAAGPGK
jgi:tetratricopeptide (TPR) repeat protein